jgi:hypothetical protein
MKILKYIALTATLCAAFAVQAKADTFTFTSDHCTGGCGPQTGGFGTVTLTQNGANVDVVVSLINGNQFVKTGAGGFQYFLFDAAGITAANITNISGAPAGTTAFMGPIHADGTGDWAWAIGCATCPNGGAGKFTGPISFTVTGTTLAAMEVGHAVGSTTELFVADILSGTTGMTGDVDVNSPPQVPDGGSTVMLLGAALGSLGMAMRFLRRS